MTQKKSGDGNGEPVTFDDLTRVGLGCLQFNPSVFWDMDYGDFMLAFEGYTERIERTEQMHWERARWIASVLLTPHTKQGKGMRPRDLIQFPWDTLQTKVNATTQKKGVDMLMKIAKPKQEE